MRIANAAKISLFSRWSSAGFKWKGVCLALFCIWLMPLIGLHAGQLQAETNGSGYDIQLDMSDPGLWTVDTVHLGTRQLEIQFDAKDQATVITPAWSVSDLESTETGARNVDHSKLHLYQLIRASDCTQADAYFEILLPREYVEEGKLEFVFSLQAGAKGDYLFNGVTFTMSDFSDDGGRYKKLKVSAADFNEPAEKQRAIERVNFIFHRNGSMVSAPIKIRYVALDLNSEHIVPPGPDVKVKNPNSFYEFTYDSQEDVDGFYARISNEDMDITRRLNTSGSAMELIPLWKNDQVPDGHSGKITLVQALGAMHDFERFEVQYALNIPEAYFAEGKMDIYLFIQAGPAGYDRWSGTQRSLSSFSDKAGQDVILTMTEQDFLTQGKKRNQIEVVGLQLNRHGSTVTEPITLKRITVKLPVDYRVDFEQAAPAEGFEKADWEAHGFADIAYITAPQRASIDKQVAHGGNQSLRLSFPKSSVGPSQGGHQAAILLEPAAQYLLSYWLKFDENFSWGDTDHGGKLPGLALGKLCSGGDVCDGSNGFTARYMWRENGAAVLYLYHMDKPHQWGEDFPLLSENKEPLLFEPGEWVNLVQRVKINTADAADGEVQVWVNGIEALNLDGLRFVNDGSKIDTFYVSTFHGGNTPGWGPLNDSYLWIDDIEISSSALQAAPE